MSAIQHRQKLRTIPPSMVGSMMHRGDIIAEWINDNACVVGNDRSATYTARGHYIVTGRYISDWL